MHPTTPTLPEQLRSDAESRLQNRSAPSSAGWVISPDTLSLLYRLSSDPDSASDALKLLHELQTYQVELDLQHAQLIENEDGLNAQLAHYRTLYEQAPAGYLLVGRDGRILQSNRAAARLFGLELGQLKGHFLGKLLSADSSQALTAILESPKPVSMDQTVHRQAPDTPRLRLVSGAAPHDNATLILVLPETAAAAAAA